MVVLRLLGFFSAVHGKGSFGRQLSERFLEVLLDLFREMSQQTVKVRGEGPRQHGKPCWCLFLCLCVCVCVSQLAVSSMCTFCKGISQLQWSKVCALGLPPLLDSRPLEHHGQYQWRRIPGRRFPEDLMNRSLKDSLLTVGPILFCERTASDLPADLQAATSTGPWPVNFARRNVHGWPVFASVFARVRWFAPSPETPQRERAANHEVKHDEGGGWPAEHRPRAEQRDHKPA